MVVCAVNWHPFKHSQCHSMPQPTHTVTAAVGDLHFGAHEKSSSEMMAKSRAKPIHASEE